MLLPSLRSSQNNANAMTIADLNSSNNSLPPTNLHQKSSLIESAPLKSSRALPDRSNTARKSRKEISLSLPVVPGKKRFDNGTIKITMANGVQPSPHLLQNPISSTTLLPPPSDGTSRSEDSRSLRSKTGGSRLKSDLATYFPAFDDIIAGVPQPPDYVQVNDIIRIINEPLKDKTAPAPTKSSQPRHKSTRTFTPAPAPQYETINLSSFAPTSTTVPAEDPLDDSVYLKPHRRSERREKQLRNIEKERAQHEKGQLESLLEALQGPDWLRAMGVTGITDGARKEWEPKRDYFIREVRILLKKFATWRDAEKRLQEEKENALRAKEGDEDDEADADEDEDEEDASSLDGPAASDIDAWAAHQLLQEAKSASQLRQSKPRPPPKPPKVIKPPPPLKPFTSFFEKPHERASALGKGRAGIRRLTLAFGHPIPHGDEMDFRLPYDYTTPDTLLANARKRRRINREKKEGDPDDSMEI